uniref:DnaD domain protein n=1 Tax=Lysinibacillus sp. D4A1_S13 TaxID=2941228 RepID=UPI0020BF4B48
VMLTTDMKLSKKYIQKIAAHWARKKVQTVREAMMLAIEEHRQYLDWADGKTNGAARGKKTVREEKRPDRMIEEETGKKQEQPALSAQDHEEQKKKIMEELKKRKKYSAY